MTDLALLLKDTPTTDFPIRADISLNGWEQLGEEQLAPLIHARSELDQRTPWYVARWLTHGERWEEASQKMDEAREAMGWTPATAGNYIRTCRRWPPGTAVEGVSIDAHHRVKDLPDQVAVPMLEKLRDEPQYTHTVFRKEVKEILDDRRGVEPPAVPAGKLREEAARLVQRMQPDGDRYWVHPDDAMEFALLIDEPLRSLVIDA